jgi:hypothetical protein
LILKPFLSVLKNGVFSIAVVTAPAGVPAVGDIPAVAGVPTVPVADTIAIVGIPADAGTVSGVLLLLASVLFFILLLLSTPLMPMFLVLLAYVDSLLF